MNGAEALEILQNVAPDLILLDINMPHMGGLAFLEIYNRDAPPVFVLASSYQDCDQVEALEYNAVQDCLVKPLTSEMVEALVKA